MNIYFDYNATTPLHPDVQTVLTDTIVQFGNPASAHDFGQQAEKIANDAKESIASFLNVEPEELLFTSGGSESNNTVLFQLIAEKLLNKPPRKLICSNIEHSSILEYSSFLKKSGIEVEYLSVDSEGFVNLNELNEKITDNSLVSIIAANNEIGTIQDLEAISEIVKATKAELHIDATQAVGKFTIDLKKLHVHYLTAAAHKIYGPRGIGLLYRRPFTRFSPMIIGGGQQDEQRAGTENQWLMAGFAKAISLRNDEMESEAIRLRELKSYFMQELSARVPFAQFNGPKDLQKALPGTINITFPGVENEMLLLYLDMAGIAISTGSACSSRSFKASHVLHAIGMSELQAFQTVRISMGRGTTKEQVDRLIEEMTTIIGRLKKD